MKKLIGIILALAMILAVAGCTKNEDKPSGGMTTKDIADAFNADSQIEIYRGYGMTIEASGTEKGLTIRIESTDFEGNPDVRELKYDFDGKILSGKFEGEDSFTGAFYSARLADVIETKLGFDPGDFTLMMNTDEIQDYTVDKDGFELNSDGDTLEIKIDTTRKATPVDLSDKYVTVEELEDVREYLINGSGTEIAGYVKLFTMCEDDAAGEYLILVSQKNGLGENAYKSVLSALEVILGSDAAEDFAANCKDLTKEGTYGDYTVDVDPELDDFLSSFDSDENYQIAMITNY